jgi:hypothetical protein
VLHRSPCASMPSPFTPAEPLGACVAHFPRDGSLPRKSDGSASALEFSRPPRRSLDYGLPARGVTCMTLSIVGFDGFVTSTIAAIATGWSDPCRVGLPPTGKPCLCTAHGLPPPSHRPDTTQAKRASRHPRHAWRTHERNGAAGAAPFWSGTGNSTWLEQDRFRLNHLP